LKDALIADRLGRSISKSQSGPDAEVFTKSPVLSSVGWGDWIGVRSESQWNNPEPEIVLACDARGRILGAALGNDVNLRDIEGRSALLLGKAKDNNASCAIGPFIRLFDERFTLDQVRRTVIALQVQAPTTTCLEGSSSMSLISRDPADLVQADSRSASLSGRLYAVPGHDVRADAGSRRARARLHSQIRRYRASLCASVGHTREQGNDLAEAPPWQLGIAWLMRNLAQRGLLPRSQEDR
jgi:fumarylacetoacetate (FAA) hydrolase family protein